MTKDELIKRMQAGEQVTLYYPLTSHVGVASRTLYLGSATKGRFCIRYGKELSSRYTFGLDSPLLDSLFRAFHAEEFWWVAYARSVALNQDLARARQDA